MAYWQKGTQSVPFENEKPQGNLDSMTLIYCNHWLHSRGQSSSQRFIYQKGRTVSLSGKKSPRANSIAWLAFSVAIDHIAGVKVYFSRLFDRRDALCPFREQKAPGQSRLHFAHLLQSLIIFQGSKFISTAYMPKGTQCVPFVNEKPQGNLDCMTRIYCSHWSHSRGQSSFQRCICQKGGTDCPLGTKSPMAISIA